MEKGKHVYSEKPMAVNFSEGEELLELSKSKSLYIGNAPDTFLGGGIQKSIELINKIKLEMFGLEMLFLLTQEFNLIIPIQNLGLQIMKVAQL